MFVIALNSVEKLTSVGIQSTPYTIRALRMDPVCRAGDFLRADW